MSIFQVAAKYLAIALPSHMGDGEVVVPSIT
jgi:hypothetical protein